MNTSQLIQTVFAAPPQQKITALNQLQDLVLNFKDPADSHYQDLLSSAQPYFTSDQWQKIINPDPEDQDLTATQQALLIPGKIIAAFLSRTPPNETRTIKDIVKEYERSQKLPSPMLTSAVIKPTTETQPTLSLRKVARLSSLKTLKTPFSKSLPKIVLTRT